MDGAPQFKGKEREMVGQPAGREMGWSRHREPIESENGDVIRLTEEPRFFCDALSRLRADLTGALETEKLAGWALCFNDTV